MAEFLKGQTAQELWKASLKPADPLKPKDPLDTGTIAAGSGDTGPQLAPKAPGTGLAIDLTA